MRYQLTVTIELKSPFSKERVGKQFASLFNFGTIRESIADALQLQNDPELVSISVDKGINRDNG
jgi:hypothetical protein